MNRHVTTELWEAICLNGTKDWIFPSIHEMKGHPTSYDILSRVKFRKFEIVYLYITRYRDDSSFQSAHMTRIKATAENGLWFLEEAEIEKNLRKLKLVTQSI